MSLLDVLRMVPRIANNVTKPIQCDVVYEKAYPTDYQGGGQYYKPAVIKALVDWKRAQVRTTSGDLTVSRSSVTFLDIEMLKRVTRGEGISESDRITLPDGTTGPILDLSGFIDAGTKLPLATEVLIG